jgi:rod shape-determining protein MreB and related proteins
MLNQLFGLFSNDMGIDLGTANTLVHVKGHGIVLSEPSVVAVHATTKKILAVGAQAKRMLGKTPGDIRAVRPMKDGVIADFETVERMIRFFIEKVHNRKAFAKPRIVIGVPSGITEVEKRAVRESAEQAGARNIYLIEEALAAAIGANISIEEPAGHMLVDIGGGTTEIAVLSLGGMVICNSVRVGGDEFDDAITQYIRKNFNLVIGESTAEDIKIRLGNPLLNKKVNKMEVRGRDSITGLPQTLEFDNVEIKKAILEPVSAIIDEIKATLDRTPPELAADIVERGIVLTGGGALLQDLDKLISNETNVPVILAENPLTCVAMGTGRFLDEIKAINKKIYHMDM